MLKIVGSDFYTYYRPSPCELRVYLQQAGLAPALPGLFEALLKRLGERHEQAYLQTFPELFNLDAFPALRKRAETIQAVEQQVPVLYHPQLAVKMNIGQHTCEVVGEPDLLVVADGEYCIRDVKISRRISEREHPEVFRQLQLYGWLYEQNFNRPPRQLEVFTGAGVLKDIPYDQGKTVLQLMEQLVAWRTAKQEPFSPVGWTKCGGCAYHNYCWSKALKQQAVALVPGVDQGLAWVLREQDINTIADLAEHFEEARLANLSRPWGQGVKKVGKNAAGIILNAKAMAQQQEIKLQPPELPEASNLVMFDLEGLPPQLDELQKIYLWGMQVYGEKPGPFQPALADFGCDGDLQGWQHFLTIANAIFQTYGDIPFVHWHHYEKTNIKMYCERFGDPEGVAQRVLDNLLDLLPITKKSMALPIPSYSLKVVEKYIGFKRSMDEYGGDWSIAKYIEATEMEDEQERQAVMAAILKYNEEDLQATWAVYTWLKGKQLAHKPL